MGENFWEEEYKEPVTQQGRLKACCKVKCCIPQKEKGSMMTERQQEMQPLVDPTRDVAVIAIPYTDQVREVHGIPVMRWDEVILSTRIQPTVVGTVCRMKDVREAIGRLKLLPSLRKFVLIVPQNVFNAKVDARELATGLADILTFKSSFGMARWRGMGVSSWLAIGCVAGEGPERPWAFFPNAYHVGSVEAGVATVSVVGCP